MNNIFKYLLFNDTKKTETYETRTFTGTLSLTSSLKYSKCSSNSDYSSPNVWGLGGRYYTLTDENAFWMNYWRPTGYSYVLEYNSEKNISSPSYGSTGLYCRFFSLKYTTAYTTYPEYQPISNLPTSPAPYAAYTFIKDNTSYYHRYECYHYDKVDWAYLELFGFLEINLNGIDLQAR